MRFAVLCLVACGFSVPAAAQDQREPAVASALARALEGIGQSSPYASDRQPEQATALTDEPTRFTNRRLCDGDECMRDTMAVGGVETRPAEAAAEVTAAPAAHLPGAPDVAAETRGAWSADDVERHVRARRDQIATCYERALARNADVGGYQEVRFVIGRDGRLQNVRLARRLDGGFAGCLRQALGRIHFPPAESATRVVYPLFLTSSTVDTYASPAPRPIDD